MVRLSFYPVGDSYLLVALVAVAMLAILAVVRPGKTIRRGRRTALAGLRLAVLILAIVAMLRPTLVTTETSRRAATLVLLADVSRSMSVPDAMGGRKTRYEALRHCLDGAQAKLADLAEEIDEVEVFAFDAQARRLEMTNGRIDLPDTPSGRQTAIGAVLEDMLRRQAGKRLLGILLLSDGAQRAYAPRELPPQTAAAQMRRLGDRLYTVPFGQARGLGEARDVAVKQLLVDQNVFVKNELAVSGQVQVDGYVNRQIPVRLRFETSPGKMTVVAQEMLRPTADGQLMSVRLGHVPEVPGQYKLTLEVPDQPGELVTTNNRLSTFVNVLAGGLNVLYVEGSPPRPDTKYLKRSLDASPEIDVDLVTLTPGQQPGGLADRFQPGKYAVYILGDVDSSAFTQEELKSLAEAVSRGAGLIMLGGFHSFGPGGYAQTPLADVLPVKMSRHERQPLGQPIRRDVHYPGPIQMRPSRFGRSHFVMMLAADRKANLDAWSRLPPLEGINRFFGLKDNGLVVAEDQHDRPVLVQSAFGAGRVMAFAGDTTWHWRMRGFEAAHKRFWRQVILWLARKDESQEGSVWVKLAQRRIGPGSRLDFTAGARSPTGEPVAGAQLKAEAVLPDGTARSIRMSRQGDHWRGTFGETKVAGDYAIRVTAQQDKELLGTARARFLVFEQDLELDNAAADARGMASLATMTDGESVAPEELPDLLDRLVDRMDELDEKTETKHSLWDSWAFFLLVIGLLSVEWYLRKRWGLV